MKQAWRKYAARIDALSPRERLMVFAAALAIILFLMITLFVEPPTARMKMHQSRMAQQQAEIAALRAQTQAFAQQADPDAANRAQRDDLRRQIAAIDERLRGLQQGLVPAQRVNGLLQEMLARNPRLQLVSMRTLPAAPLVMRPDPSAGGTPTAPLPQKPGASEANVFKHGVDITLQGSYADLHDYLSRLERLPWRMFWNRVRLETDEYPRLTMTVTIHTLSLDKAWLQV